MGCWSTTVTPTSKHLRDCSKSTECRSTVKIHAQFRHDQRHDLCPAGAELLERYPLEQLSLEKEALYRSIFEESIAPTRGLVDFLKSLKEHGIKIAVGSSGQYEQCQFRIVPLSYCGVLRCDCQRRYDFARKTRSGSLPVGCEIVGIKARRVRRNRGCSRRYRGGTPGRNGLPWRWPLLFRRDRIPDYDILSTISHSLAMNR